MKPEEYRDNISKNISGVKIHLELIKKRYKIPSNMKPYDYTWVILGANILYQIEDLLLIIDGHSVKKIKTKTSLYTVLRGILEDFFYMRLILIRKKMTPSYLSAYIYHSHEKTLSHLKSLLKLADKGKLILKEDDSLVVSVNGLPREITKYEDSMRDILNREGVNFEEHLKVFSSIKNVCEKYDEIMGIDKVEENEEALSLEWLYNYIYKFQSGFTHQRVNMKELVIDCVWKGIGYKDDNIDVLSLTNSILETILIMK